MNKLVTSVVAVAISLGQATGQTTTTSQSQNQGKKTETHTQTVTQNPDGSTITTTTITVTPNMAASFGVKASVNLSNFIVRNVDNYQSKMKFGFSAGVFLKLESKGFALQYELLLRHKNFEMKNAENQAHTNYKYWGLELPIYFMGQINTDAGKVLIGAGPYVRVALDGKQNPGNLDLYVKNKTTNKSIMHRWDFGLGTIVGYEFKNGLSNFGTYQAGLINTLSTDKDNMSLKNQTVSFGIGYKF